MIEWKNISMTLGGRKVLSDISISCAKGEILFILGKSGAGKSVLLKAAVGFLPYQEGEIYLDGQPASRLSGADWQVRRRQCALIFQFPTLLDQLTIEENVALGIDPKLSFKEVTRKAVKEKLDWIGFPYSRKDQYPHELSFGLQKRVNLARVLMLSPQVILFDEPTTSLDPQSMAEVNDLIANLAKELKMSCVVVSHDLHCAFEIADRAVMIDGGKILFEGTTAAFQKSEEKLVRAFVHEAELRRYV